jgi:hypothetical protein
MTPTEVLLIIIAVQNIAIWFYIVTISDTLRSIRRRMEWFK